MIVHCPKPIMSTVENGKDTMMKTYYEKAFPCDLFEEWLVYGRGGVVKKEQDEEESTAMVDHSTSSSSKYPYFKQREFACIFIRGGVEKMVRYQCYDDAKQMRRELVNHFPARIEIGAVYDMPLVLANRGRWKPDERELIFGMFLH